MSQTHSGRTRPVGTTSATNQRPAQHLAEKVMSFNLAGELAQLRQEEAWRQHNHNAKTLVKEPDLRIVLIAMKSGGKLEEHQASARLAVQTLKGKVRLHLPGQSVEIAAGHIVTLERDIKHHVEALEESDVLLTLAWPD